MNDDGGSDNCNNGDDVHNGNCGGDDEDNGGDDDAERGRGRGGGCALRFDPARSLLDCGRG